MDKERKNWEQPAFKPVYGTNIATTRWGWAVTNFEKLLIKKYVDIGFGTYIQADAGVVIEENVQIGSHVSIYSVSTINNKNGPVTLKKNCKIGSHAVIMPGVTIGENAVVGAFTYLTHDVPANKIIFPKPELIIKDRTI